MSAENLKPTDYFDPEQWGSIYDTHEQSNSAFVFKHGFDLVQDISLNISSPGELWLDVGSGTGHLAAELSKIGRSVIGVDHDPRMIDYAKKRFLNKHSTDKLKFVTASAYRLPIDDNTIDGLVATSLAGCLLSPDDFFREAYRVLRKGGYAIITFTNHASVLLKTNSRIRKFRSKAGKSSDDNYYCLCRSYNCDAVTNDFKRLGFRVVNVRYYNFFLNFGNWLIPPQSLALCLECLNKYKISGRLGRNFIIVAQKA